jgi:hypothetical protein
MEINPNQRSASMTVSPMALAMLVCSQLGGWLWSALAEVATVMH